MSRPEFHKPEIEPYSEEQVRCLLEVCDQTVMWHTPHQRMVQSARPSVLRDRAILVTLVDTRVRASELGNFKVQDYDAKTGRAVAWASRM